MKKVSLIILSITILTIVGQAQITDLPVNVDYDNVVPGTSVNISTEGSQVDVSYYLRNASNNVLSGPIVGDGTSNITFNTVVNNTTTFNVFAESGDYHALNISGTDSYVNCNINSRSITNHVTMMAWIKTTQTGETVSIIDKYGGENGFKISLMPNGTIEVACSYGTQWGDGAVVSSSTVNDGEWHHIAGKVTVEGATVYCRVFVDGVLELTEGFGTTTGSLINSAELRLGRSQATSGNDFQGQMDNCALFNIGLNGTAIQGYMNSCLNGSETDLVALFNFDEQPGTSTVNDYSTTGLDGTLENINATESWIIGNSPSCGGSQMQMTETVTVNVILGQIDDLPVNVDYDNVVPGTSVTISTEGSQADVNYYLRDNISNSILSGPIVGDGTSNITFNTIVNSTTTFNVYAESQFQHALDITGTDSYVGCNTSGRNIVQDVTMMAWIKTTQSGQTVSIIDKHEVFKGFKLSLLSNGTIEVAGEFGIASSGEAVSTSIVNDGQWHHVAGKISIDNGTVYYRIFVDGDLESTQAGGSTSGTLTNSVELRLGKSESGNDFQGQMDNCALFNIGLDGTTLRGYMNSCMTGSESNLVALFNFDEQPSSTTVTDYSTLGLDGTLGNINATESWIAGFSPSCGEVLQMTQTVTVTSGTSNITDLPVSVNFPTVFAGESVNISTTGSQTGVDYYLRDASNTVLAGPIAGDGTNDITFTTIVNSNTTYNIYGESYKNHIEIAGDESHVHAGTNTRGVVNDVTIMTWVKTYQTTNGNIFHKFHDVNGGYQLVLKSNGTVLLAGHYGNNTVVTATSTSTINDGVWHHVAATIALTDGDQVWKIYIDGTLEMETGGPYISGDLASATTSMRLGKHATAGLNDFWGKMDNFAMFNTALDLAQIQTYKNSCMTGNEANLTCLFDFDEPSGSETVTDLSPTNANGTLINMIFNSCWLSGSNPSCGAGEALIMAQTVTVEINSISDLPVSVDFANVFPSENVNISTAGSQVGADYYLRDNTTNDIIAGPIAGDGTNDVTFNVEVLESATFNVYAEVVKNHINLTETMSNIDAGSNNRGIGTDFTIMTWIRTTQAGPVDIYNKYHSTQGGHRLVMNPNGTVKIVGQYGNDGILNQTSTTAVNDGEWHHIAVSVNQWENNGTFYYGWVIYIDGVEEDGDNYGDINGDISSTASLLIGKHSTDVNDFHGEMDNFAIFNSAIGTNLIQTYMNSCLVGNEPNLTCLFNFNNSAGATTVQDLSPTGIDGTLLNIDENTCWLSETGPSCGVTESLQMTETVTVTSGFANLPIALDYETICNGSSANVTTTGSEDGVFYNLQDDLSNIIGEPVAGDGNNITLNTGETYTTTSFHVIARPEENIGIDTESQTSFSINCTNSNRTLFRDITIMAWVKTSQTTEAVICGKYNVSEGGYMFVMNSDGTVMLFAKMGTAAMCMPTSTSIINDGDWHHVTAKFTYESSQQMARIYVDGVLEETVEEYYSTGDIQNIEDMEVAENFEGQIDNFAIFNAGLSDAQINEYMNSCLTGSEDNNVCLFNLNEEAGTTTIQDDSPVGINGVMQNGDPQTIWLTGVSPTGCGVVQDVSEEITLNVTPNYDITESDLVCSGGSYTFPDGTIQDDITSQVVYESELTTTETQCDSIITTTLDVITVDNTTYVNENTITANQTGAAYKWLDCDNGNAEIPGETNQYFTPTETGNYAVQVIYNGCTVVSECVNITITGINNFETIELTIAPNPTSNILNIYTKETINQVEIFNLNGIMINTISENVNEINVSELPQGMYILKIRTNKGIHHSNFIKN